MSDRTYVVDVRYRSERFDRYQQRNVTVKAPNVAIARTKASDVMQADKNVTAFFIEAVGNGE